ncbi:hypothetical protein QFZ40_001065 [Arthrobacter pascens]|nr:hypothetical protein [Arthrobacter pascens]
MNDRHEMRTGAELLRSLLNQHKGLERLPAPRQNRVSDIPGQAAFTTALPGERLAVIAGVLAAGSFTGKLISPDIHGAEQWLFIGNAGGCRIKIPPATGGERQYRMQGSPKCSSMICVTFSPRA